MASGRPSTFRKGGGFLNNVDGVITNYQFTDVGPGGKKATSKTGFNSLFVRLFVRVEGATSDVDTHLFVGDADQFEISEDGRTLSPVDDSYVIGGDTAWHAFLGSMVENGLPESAIPEDSINYDCIIGARVRFEQVTNVEATKKLGKRKDPKTGKEYDRKDLVVSKVYELAKAGNKAQAKRQSTKGNGAAKDVDLTEAAVETLLSILAENDNSIPKSKLPLKLNLKLKAHPQKDELRRMVYSDDFLSQQLGWTFDPASKTQVITVA